MPTLVVKTSEHEEVEYVLTGERITVGRRPDNTIQVLDRSVSAHHAEFLLVDGHYRLHDLQSTNLTFVDGAQVADYHLRAVCKLQFGNVPCSYDPAPHVAVLDPPFAQLTPLQMEKDLAFMRADNQELLNKIDSLQRRIDILSSARLITSKSAALSGNAGEEVDRLRKERDELRYQNSGLKLELEKLRDEISSTGRERDLARQAYELLQAERSLLQDELKTMDKGTTQRIIVPSLVPTAVPGPMAAER